MLILSNPVYQHFELLLKSQLVATKLNLYYPQWHQGSVQFPPLFDRLMFAPFITDFVFQYLREGRLVGIQQSKIHSICILVWEAFVYPRTDQEIASHLVKC